jgi:inorganic phosphate transporter, PiT family
VTGFLGVSLMLIAGGFALVNGINDGGVLIANSLKVPSLRVVPAALGLTLAVAVVPLVLGTRVADTLGHRLVDLEGTGGHRALAAAVTAAVVVVLLLARLGLPTSLTLATIGGITGSGLGGGRAVSWAVVLTVLVLAAIAPLVGAGLAFGATRVARRVTSPVAVGWMLSHAHRAAFSWQCVAYGANDGQKMLAVATIALGATGQTFPPGMVLLGLGAFFLLGTGLGVRRMAGTMGAGVLATRPTHVVTAEVAAGAAVLGTGFLGTPVSMTQAVTGALVGGGVSEGPRRVRWQLVARIGAAWMFTLPAALVGGAVLTAAVEVLM